MIFKKRDDNIYRTIFEADPIPTSHKKARDLVVLTDIKN